MAEENEGLALLKRLARERNGECLSTVYTSVRDTYLWHCNECGRTWEASAHGVVRKGRFCKPCAIRRAWNRSIHRITREAACALARERGGEFLSTEILSTRHKHLWRCGCGQEWQTSYSEIKQGRWCPACGRKKAKAAATANAYTREEINAFAKSLGGELIDAEYKNSRVPHRFRCVNGHVFSLSPAKLTKSNPLERGWCRKCSNTMNLSEEICRAIVEAAFGHRFLSAYPGDWLINSRGRKMQLDGYSEELRMAFEYQGQQHFREVSKFKNCSASVAQRMEDDASKKRLCQEAGITLVCIPYFPTLNMTAEMLVSHVSLAFAAAGVPMPPVTADCAQSAIAREISQPMRGLQDLAKSRGGEIVSSCYLGGHAKYLWRCSSGHTWEAQANNVKFGQWCPHCAGCARWTIEKMHSIAAERGGKCLSDEYKNIYQHLRWECYCGHQWSSPASSVVQKGRWCPTCGNRKGFEKARDGLLTLLSATGFRLKSAYAGNRSSISVTCHAGHETAYSRADHLIHLLKTGALQCKACSELPAIPRKSTGTKLVELLRARGYRPVTDYKGRTLPITIACSAGHEVIIKEPTQLARRLREDRQRCFACEFAETLAAGGFRPVTAYAGYCAPMTIECKSGHARPYSKAQYVLTRLSKGLLRCAHCTPRSLLTSLIA